MSNNSKAPSSDTAPRKNKVPYELKWYEFADKKRPVYGLARRKGELNPRKWGLSFEEGLLGHKALEGSHELPPLDRAEYKVWKKDVMEQYKEKMEKEGRGKGPGVLEILFGGGKNKE